MTTLYHYCSNATFLSIIQNQAIRLSLLSLSNDSKEGKLVLEMMHQFAVDDALNKKDLDFFHQSLSILGDYFDAIGFCLSEEKDLLSQWRGYADDANGVAIGFSSDFLRKSSMKYAEGHKMNVSLNEVEYDFDAQKKLLYPTYKEIKSLIDNGALKSTGRGSLLDSRTKVQIEKDDNEIKKKYQSYSVKTLTLITKMFILKHSAFKEEKEWRILSYYARGNEGDTDFRACVNSIIPYKEFNLREYNFEGMKDEAILEVVLGPKNITPTNIIKNLLLKNGFNHVDVIRSDASYR